jgi:hypothetical protein
MLQRKLARACGFALCVGLAAPVWAADAKGDFAIDGAGSKTCANFIEARTKKSTDYFLFAGWIEGYVTGTNQYTKDTYDFTPWQSIDLLLVALGKYCEKNSAQPFIVAVTGMLSTLKADRLQSKSELVMMQFDGRGTFAYRAVLEDVQRMLAARKEFNGKVDGNYSPELRDALMFYQSRSGLVKSGLPDQPTLLKLYNESGHKPGN